MAGCLTEWAVDRNAPFLRRWPSHYVTVPRANPYYRPRRAKLFAPGIRLLCETEEWTTHRGRHEVRLLLETTTLPGYNMQSRVIEPHQNGVLTFEASECSAVFCCFPRLPPPGAVLAPVPALPALFRVPFP